MPLEPARFSPQYLVSTVAPPANYVRALPDGETFLFVGNRAELWDVPSQRRVRFGPADFSALNSVTARFFSISDDAKLFAASRSDQKTTIDTHDLVSAKVNGSVTYRNGATANCCCFLPQSHKVLCGFANTSIHEVSLLYDIDSHTETQVDIWRATGFHSAPEFNKLYATCEDRGLGVYDLTDLTLLDWLQAPRSSRASYASAASREKPWFFAKIIRTVSSAYLLLVEEPTDSTRWYVSLWAIDSHQLLFRGPILFPEESFNFAIEPDNCLGAFSYQNPQMVKLISLEDLSVIRQWYLEHSPATIEFLPDATHLLVTSGNTLFAFHAEYDSPVWEWTFPHKIHCWAISPKGVLVVLDENSTRHVFSIEGYHCNLSATNQW